MTAFEEIVLPALRRFGPDLIIVACGLDANGFDPLARMQAGSETFRAMTAAVKSAAADLCGGRLVIVHEGGYSEAVVPFCGLAVIEALSGHRTAVIDPFQSAVEATQPPPEMDSLEARRIAEMRQLFGL